MASDGGRPRANGGPGDETAATSTRPTISTHVLDTPSGRPADGVHVTLWRLDGDEPPGRMTQALTDADGRVRDLLVGLGYEAVIIGLDLSGRQRVVEARWRPAR